MKGMGSSEDIPQRLANLLSKDDDVELAILTKSSLDGPRKRALIASIGALTGRPARIWRV